MGILGAAVIDRIIKEQLTDIKIDLTVFENDKNLLNELRQTLDICKEKCSEHNIELSVSVFNSDFITTAVDSIKSETQFFSVSNFNTRFDLIIMNPPYKKIRSDSYTRKSLSSVSIETSNLYLPSLLCLQNFLKMKAN